MPIYEYRCPSCGWTVEQLFFPGEEENVPICDECGTKTRRIPSRFGFKFKDAKPAEVPSKPKFIDDDEDPDFN